MLSYSKIILGLERRMASKVEPYPILLDRRYVFRLDGHNLGVFIIEFLTEYYFQRCSLCP